MTHPPIHSLPPAWNPATWLNTADGREHTRLSLSYLCRKHTDPSYLELQGQTVVGWHGPDGEALHRADSTGQVLELWLFSVQALGAARTPSEPLRETLDWIGTLTGRTYSTHPIQVSDALEDLAKWAAAMTCALPTVRRGRASSLWGSHK